MSYRHPSETDSCIHIATKTSWWDCDLTALCGWTEAFKSQDVVVTLSDLDDFPAVDGEYVCPFCLEHEDYPLLLLAHSGE
jgi:hypothetical protein